MWYGEYIHTLDSKDRFILPVKFRDKIKGFDNKTLYLTRGLDGCLVLYAESEWRALEEKLKALSFTKKQSRFFNRLYFSGASEIEMDSQGRLLLPEYLKEFARISKEILIVGVADRIEIWDKGCWDKFYSENKDRFEEMAEDLFES